MDTLPTEVLLRIARTAGGRSIATRAYTRWALKMQCRAMRDAFYTEHKYMEDWVSRCVRCLLPGKRKEARDSPLKICAWRNKRVVYARCPRCDKLY